jgi:phospholipid/cholesterol/gamma-HCH transport system ATP-binding protein
MIELKGLYKKFGDNEVLKGVDLTIPQGETLVIVGKSGCGKSVMLKLIVGLLKPDSGTVVIDGKLVNTMNQKELYEMRKDFGYLFQSGAIFDSLTVEENVALPLVESDTVYSAGEIKNRVEEKLELVGLPGIGHLKPSELSGGMRKRVGLARAMITNPSYILYDEPTTGLDPIMSDSIDSLIFDVKAKVKATAIVVTHDMFSVKNVADKVAMMHEGKIYFTGTPEELMSSKDAVIYEFVKRTNS